MINYVKSNKKLSLIVLISLGGLIFIVPIIINALMFKNFWGVQVETDNTWIGFFASYLGAIFGGIISGLLTLGGVILTINNQKNYEFKNEFPQKMLSIRIVSNHLDKVSNTGYLVKTSNYRVFFDYLLHIKSNADEILREAAKVSGEFFIQTENVVNIVTWFSNGYDREIPEHFNQTKDEYYDSIYYKFDEFLLGIEDALDDLEKIKKSMIEKNDKL